MPVSIRGANEHNLRDVDVDFSDGLTVVTGVSGSGKTSLVFDTLHHEANRRFLDVFGTASSSRRLAPAQVRAITGLGPAVAVGQNLLNRNPGSTLATASGLHPLLRLLYARFGERHCPTCDTPVSVLSADEIVDALQQATRRQPVTVVAPLVRATAGSHRTLLASLGRDFADVLRVDGRPYRSRPLDPAQPHDIDIEIDRLDGRISARRARQAVEAVRALGVQTVELRAANETRHLASAPVCPVCGTWFQPLEPVHFHAGCPHCAAAGCARCAGTGMHPEAAAVRWSGLRLPELLARSVDAVTALFAAADLPPSADRLRAEIDRRLDALATVGLGYITLDRPSPSVSRGEAQRVRLAVALTSRLEDVLHVLDEPTIGQHPHDVARLLPAFRQLPGPVVYVEHDRVAAAVADAAVDLGPGAGARGGRLAYSGDPAGLWRADTPTGRYFSLRQQVPMPARRPAPESLLTVLGAEHRNLAGIDVAVPVGRLTAVTGVSGSGKSTLVEEVLVASLAAGEPFGCAALDGPRLKPVLVDQKPIGLNPRSNPATYTKLADLVRDAFAESTGLSPSHFSFNRPEGACPACEGLGATEVKMRYLPSTWIPCTACGGRRFSEEVLAATIQLGDSPLSIADVYGATIDDVAELIASSAAISDRQRDSAGRILQALCDVGLGYLSLGQPSPTLSGGEAQRVKLARFLGRRSLARQLIVLDEPTTGLHPADVHGLLVVLDRLVRAGATVVVVEHNLDLIRAADWVVDLGPGSGPDGGRLIYAGAPEGLTAVDASRTGQALLEEADLRPHRRSRKAGRRRDEAITIRNARAHNLQGVDVDIPKGRFSVVTGVSGSGKSSLVIDVLESEARRRFLESLSLYERQATREGPEAPVDSVRGLGVALAIGDDRRRYDPRATVGTTTELLHHLAVLLARLGTYRCPQCATPMRRGDSWLCPGCGATARIAEPRHFASSTFAAACTGCNGVGSLRRPCPEKLIVHPGKPLCAGAMYSPGFFPQGYLGKPFNGGYYLVQALAARHGFDPHETPWDEMSQVAQQAFLFGEAEPLQVHYESRKGGTSVRQQRFPGFYGWIRDWDVGGTYTDTEPCTDCRGSGLRPEFANVELHGHDTVALKRMPLSRLAAVVGDIELPADEAALAGAALDTVRHRLRFLTQVGLGYLHLDRPTGTLSAGEAQRIRLASLLGSGLTSLTVLVDEPSRGLHPSEVGALVTALTEVRDAGNTVLAVEHDPVLIAAADHLIDMGPGAGAAGGHIVASGTPDEVAAADTVTGRWLRGAGTVDLTRRRRPRQGELVLRGARGCNLRGDLLTLPLGLLTGVCGVSGSGKSSLIIDTLGRVLAPRKQTTSVAYEPIEPGAHEAVEGAPERTVVVDQSRAGVGAPADCLDLTRILHALYADSDDARALGLDEKQLSRRCSACHGGGVTTTDMGFLPAVRTPCETCRGTGYLAEAWEVRVDGISLPEVFALTIEEVAERFADVDKLQRPLGVAREVGLGYLVLRQPAQALSGGEAQRLKIARELCRRATSPTLYLLDEPTVGQHLEDVARLIGVLHRLVDAGHTVVVVEHHAHLLAACDWLVELGPGGGPEGGRIIAAGTPRQLARRRTPTAPYLREILEAAS